jgi:hypothetical protein
VDGFIVRDEFVHACFELIEAAGQLLVGDQQFAQLNECSHDLDVHGDSAFAVENGRQHRYALLGEHVGLVAPAAAPAF